VERAIMVKEEGKKRAIKKFVSETFDLKDIKSTKPFIKFK
jgi:hypothetical protein